jgi:hypothetical protein
MYAYMHEHAYMAIKGELVWYASRNSYVRGSLGSMIQRVSRRPKRTRRVCRWPGIIVAFELTREIAIFDRL